MIAERLSMMTENTGVRNFGSGRISGNFSGRAKIPIWLSARSENSPEIRTELKQIHRISYYKKRSAEQGKCVVGRQNFVEKFCLYSISST